jgi:hypothetical protein
VNDEIDWSKRKRKDKKGNRKVKDPPSIFNK